MKKSDIQRILKNSVKTKIVWDNLDYVIYPKFLIDAMLKDFKEDTKR